MEDPGTPDQGERLGGLVRPYVINTNTGAPARYSSSDGWYTPPGKIIAPVPGESAAVLASSYTSPPAKRPSYLRPTAVAAAAFAALACLAFLASTHHSPTALAGKCRPGGCYQAAPTTPVVLFPVTTIPSPIAHSPTIRPAAQVDNVQEAAAAGTPAEVGTHSPSAPMTAPSCGHGPGAALARWGNHASCGESGPNSHQARHRRF
jgi:hypothetical protein